MGKDHAAHRAQEARILAQVGAALWPQNLRIYVRLPGHLVIAAQAAWTRDDIGGDPRGRAEQVELAGSGHLALIGLAVTERGQEQPDGTVLVDLEAWQIGAALEAADRVGLLGPLPD